MSPSHKQLAVASDEEMPDLVTPKPLTSRWRGLGLAVTVVGLVCVVGANWPSTKQVSVRQRFGKMRDSIVQAFEATVLDDKSSMVTSLEFEFGEDGGEKPEAMEISAKIHVDEDPQGQFVFENTLLAEEGKGEDLKETIDALWEWWFSQAPEDQAADVAKMKEMLKVTQEGDEVRIAITDPAVFEGPAQKIREALSQSQGEKPELAASFKFGRDLDTLYDHMTDNAIVAFQGLHFKLDAKFKGLVVELLEAIFVDHMQAMVNTDFTKQAGHWGEGVAKLGGKLELRYKKENELGDLFETVPTMQALFDMLKMTLMGMPAEGQKLFLDLEGVINGIKTTEIRGLPEDYKITIDYHNFKPAKLLVKMIEELKPGEGGEESEEATEEPTEDDENEEESEEATEEPTEDDENEEESEETTEEPSEDDE